MVVVVVVGLGRGVVVVVTGGSALVVVVVVTAVVVVVVVVVVLEEEDGFDDELDATVCDGSSGSVGSSDGVLMSETRAGSPPPGPAGSLAPNDPAYVASTQNAVTTTPTTAPVASRAGPLIAANTRFDYLVHSIGSSKPVFFYSFTPLSR
ncbi:hypothetical protein [Lentzea cavernae]|uniref:hypothetical protein n=1 Tax=Lentzea cavernae TaxID=2020703 RepID=UPI00174B00C8|nr:hypothetical protein [Lentzea cavernae]